MSKIKIEQLNDDQLESVVDTLWNYSDKDYIKRGLDSGEDYEDFCHRKEHCRKTAQIAVNIFDTYADETIIEYRNQLNFACLIHDIRKINIEYGHAKEGKIFFRDNINGILSLVLKDNIELKKSDKKIIGKIIEYHNGKKKEDAEQFFKQAEKLKELNEKEGQILKLILFTRMADKFSKYPYKEKEKVIKKAQEQTENLILADKSLLKLRNKIIDNAGSILDSI